MPTDLFGIGSSLCLLELTRWKCVFTSVQFVIYPAHGTHQLDNCTTLRKEVLRRSAPRTTLTTSRVGTKYLNLCNFVDAARQTGDVAAFGLLSVQIFQQPICRLEVRPQNVFVPSSSIQCDCPPQRSCSRGTDLHF